MKSKRCPVILLCAFVSKEKKRERVHTPRKKRKGRDVFLFFFFLEIFSL